MSVTTLRDWRSTGLASIDEVAAHLSIGRTALFEMIRDGRFGPSAHKLGRSTRFLQEEVDAWLHAQMPRSEVWPAMWKQQLESRTTKARKR